MKQLRVFSVLAISLVSILLIAACGGDEGVPSDAVAVVDGQEIPRAQFDALLQQTKAGYKQQGRDVPKAGTPEFTTLKTNIVAYLVQRAQFEEKAKELGIDITDEQIDAELAKIKKDFFGGSDAKMQAQLKKQNITLDSLKRDIRAKLIQEKLYSKVTGDVTVTDKEVRDYYDQHKDLYGQPESREVRHILVEKKSLADDLYAQLQGGGNFAQLAKKYSKDPGSAAQGGKLTVSKGQTVPEFDKLAFELKTGELGKPVHTQYGWHIIQALSDVKPAQLQPFAKVEAQIKAQLLQTKKSNAMTKWVDDVKKELGDKTTYQVGFEPPAQATTSTATK
ncbi:MAG TPA: peptidylprolyl isomerase [Gaiellaceae bacterium]|jgi:parvulin-like peptidyl-prolyl isomerase|nr:peptidylprolyl isomerase [Gaiellaceae bacterium]